jgi:polysaccharide export outer membrane protein
MRAGAAPPQAVLRLRVNFCTNRDLRMPEGAAPARTSSALISTFWAVMQRPNEIGTPASSEWGWFAHAHVVLRAPIMTQFTVTMICVGALTGCRTANLSARNMPAELQAPLLPNTSAINLERLGGDVIGASQIGPGDLVSITIVSGSADERVTPVPARVAMDGTIAVPLVGTVHVGGMEPVAAERQVAAAAVERGIYKQPAVTLTVTARATNHVTVLGAVAKPGVVELPRGSCDLASAIAAAGGLSSNAGTRVEILHRGSAFDVKLNEQKTAGSAGVELTSFTEPFDPAGAGPAQISRIDLSHAGAGAAENRALEDRDVVNVLPQEKRLVHVTGLVRKPDQFELIRDKDIRVLDVIAMAGGVTSSVADKVLVIRKLPNMTDPSVIEISMSRAKRDGDENLRLAEGDLISVEETMTTMTVDTISKFFRVALGLNGSVAAF